MALYLKLVELESGLNEKDGQLSFIHELKIYVGRIKTFTKEDWIAYGLWIGLMLGLLFSIAIFLFVGKANGVQFPVYVWTLLGGTFVFVWAIAVDTIGHRTIYKDEIKKAEQLVHHLTIFAGVTSVLLLCLGYPFPGLVRYPAAVLVFLSILYSLVDEYFHWHRYYNQNSDRVEMWSHFFILLGHIVMIASWWVWYDRGYEGVAETLPYFGL